MKKANMDDAIRSTFEAFKQQRQLAEATLDDINRRAGELQAEARQLRMQPASKAEFAAALVRQLEGYAEAGRQRIKRTLWAHRTHPDKSGLHGHATPDQLTWEHVQKVNARQTNFSFFSNALISAADSNTAQLNLTFDGIGLYAVFEDQIKAALIANLERVEWPYPDAPIGQDRAKRLAVIEAELAELEAKKEELVAVLAEVIAG